MTKNKQSQLRLTCEARDPCYEIKITLQKANKKNYKVQFSTNLMVNNEIKKNNLEKTA